MGIAVDEIAYVFGSFGVFLEKANKR